MTKRWYHVIINARCSWLHGDRRGFRDRGHRVHSSGNYKHLPPDDEHARLRNYFEQRSGDAVRFDCDVRVIILRTFVTKVISLNHRIIASSCGAEHLHALIELPLQRDERKREIGKAKQRASHAVRELVPGSIWSAGGEFKQINDVSHLHNAYRYIRAKQEPGTVVWSHAIEEDWITHPNVGAIIVLSDRSQGRIDAPTPVSEPSEDPGPQR